MKKKKIDVKAGDIILQFVGDATPKKYRENDKMFICKYIITEVIDSSGDKKKTIQIERMCDNAIPKSANRFWFGDVIIKYNIIERKIK